MATRLEIQAMIAGIGTGEPNTAAEMRILLTALLDPPSGTIIIKDVSNAYITANFDGTGLGINEEVGYAIVNGLNGTRNWDDRIPLAYGVTNPVMGAMKGSNTHELSIEEMPAHKHSIVANNDSGSSGGASYPPGGGAFVDTTSNGGGQEFSIENKTIVTLITMKL